MGAEELETRVAIPIETALVGPAGRAPRPLDVDARRRAGHDRVRARRRLLRASRQFVAERVAQVAAAAGHRRAAAVEPDRPAQRDLRVHARGRAGRRRPDDAARPRRVRGQEPPARRARRRRRRAARRLPARVPGPARSGPHGGARRHARRGRARGRGRERRTPPAASSRRGQMEWTVRAVGRAPTRRATCASTVVAMRGGTPVLLGDVADVREAPAVRRGIAHRLARRGRELPDREAVRRRHRGGRARASARRSTRSRSEPARRASSSASSTTSRSSSSRRSAASGARC